ncbi:MAG: hypothetical protein H6Q20_2199 [Bacteroidetes bacterium]|nr:hypothetical protein [Bacteroidota bacterium]
MILLKSPFTSPYFNLAAEEYLFSEKSEDILFLYVNEPSVIVGSNQVIGNEVDLEFCKRHGIHVLRRMSGGGAVYHDTGNINYSFLSAKNENLSPLSNQFLLPVVDVLGDLGIPVHIGVRKDLWLPGEFKVSGTASHITRNRELHHGTLLFDTQIEYLEKALTSRTKNVLLKGTPSVPSPVKNIRTYLAECSNNTPEPESFFENISFAFEKKYNALFEYVENCAEIEQLIQSKYKSDDWNFKK